MTLTCCQDHILTENIWFVWSETSYSGDERRCYRCGTNEQLNERTVKIELLSQWKLEAEFRKNTIQDGWMDGLDWTDHRWLETVAKYKLLESKHCQIPICFVQDYGL